MKDLSATTKFNFKKTTITVFNKQASGQVKLSDDWTDVDSTLLCSTIATHIGTSGIFGNQ